LALHAGEAASAPQAQNPRPIAERLVQAALEDRAAFERLAWLCDTFGPRLSGSTNLAAAIDWVLQTMQRDGLENVRAEEVFVPHWVRGRESLELVLPQARKLKVLGLGGTVGTSSAGLTAEVLVVKSFEDLRARSPEAKGRIVLFNQPFTTYGATLPIRSRGAIEAARCGAVASLIRSITPVALQLPHAGMMRYQEGVERIPHAAITVEDAELLQRLQDRGQRAIVRLGLEARTLPDAKSFNVLAEIVGREKPREVVVVSGHLDSWDLGQGAMDDAGGCVAAWEATRLLRRLDMRPRRTVRVILWVNEENGLRGSRTYVTNHLAELKQHVLAIESDLGVFKPTGFAFIGSPTALEQLRTIGRELEPLGAGRVVTDAGQGAADLMALQGQGVPVMELLTDNERYFWYHHTEADTVDKLDRGDFNRCVAALAVMTYLVADLPGPLPR
jgi:carboxypeptidase Q